MPPTKKVVQKEVVEAEVPVKLAPKKVDVNFFMRNLRKFRTYHGDIPINGDNSIISVKVNDPDYDAKIEFLRGSKQNVKNGGVDFLELGSDDEDPRAECMLDTLIGLSRESLITMVNNPEGKLNSATRGRLIMSILGESGLLK